MSSGIRAHTILFTEDCPLDCRYCELQLESDYNTCEGQSFEFINQKIRQYIEEDKRDGKRSQFTFTGGEPFLYWDWIKKIIETYGKEYIYHFNTSGYLFTEENLKFLSQYNSQFTLSIDGGEMLTNYLRPVKGNRSHTGYFKKMKEIVPVLQYYFPNTIAKLIINNRYVDLLYENYLELERVGFRKVSLILDFNSRPSYATHPTTRPIIQRLWNDEDTKILQEQMSLITKEILIGFSMNIRRMEITNFNNIAEFLLKQQKDYSTDNLLCNIFEGRTLETMTNSKDRTCFSGLYDNLDDAKKALIEEFNSCNGKCPHDEDCPAFLYCANYNCPISSYHATKSFLKADELECIMAKASYFSVVALLQNANDICPDSLAYKQYLNQFNYKGKEEYLNGISNTLLPL